MVIPDAPNTPDVRDAQNENEMNVRGAAGAIETEAAAMASASIDRLCRREAASAPEVVARAREIVDDVRVRGDAAVRQWTEQIEGRRLEALEVAGDAWRERAAATSPEVREAIERAHARIRRFHDEEARRLAGAGFTLDEDGGQTRLALRVRPLERVGLYVPGGTARYPSSVLMAAAAARAAGVGEVVMVTPGPSPETLAAALVAGVDRVFAIGGAQAVGALAYGTESVPRVDKIVGPGNAYVAAAKRLVFGDVDIDQVAGPSEILIWAEDCAGANAAWLAADLLSQAEHDADAYAVMVTTSEALGRRVAAEVTRQVATLPRREIAERSLRANGAVVVVGSRAAAHALVERFAPEHLELVMDDAAEVAESIRHAGAIFVGAHTPEAAGDYMAGPNHVLPTGGAARFGSPLGVHDFLKRTSVLAYGAATLVAQAQDIMRLAEVEGLEAHGRAVAARLEEANGGTEVAS
jgi:histidinol dehydrogenase